MSDPLARRGGGDPGRITVLYSLAPPDGTTKYVNHIVEGADERVELRFFTWRAALTGHYDVFHVHWPELTLRGRTAVKRFLRRRAADLLFVLLRSRRTPMVRTVHNVVPHEAGGRAEERTLGRYDRHTTLYISLNPTTQTEGDTPVVTIPHGHYKDLYARFSQPPSKPGRILYFGIIRPYKGVKTLLDEFLTLDRPDLELRIVGSPSTGQREMVERAAAADGRITARLKFVPDDELVKEIALAELVVLPYREMHNSGAILAALSVGRPVLAPFSGANAALSEEVGDGWVFGYDGKLTGELIERTLSAVRDRARPPLPNLDARDVTEIGREHYSAYLRAIRIAKGEAR